MKIYNTMKTEINFKALESLTIYDERPSEFVKYPATPAKKFLGLVWTDKKQEKWYYAKASDWVSYNFGLSLEVMSNSHDLIYRDNTFNYRSKAVIRMISGVKYTKYFDSNDDCTAYVKLLKLNTSREGVNLKVIEFKINKNENT